MSRKQEQPSPIERLLANSFIWQGDAITKQKPLPVTHVNKQRPDEIKSVIRRDAKGLK